MKVLLTVPRCLAESRVARQLLTKAALMERHKGSWLFFCSDPTSGHLGSGGGTAHALELCYAAERGPDARGEVEPPTASPNFFSWLKRERRLIIHAGGQSCRLPGYGPCGKSLTPLPMFDGLCGQSPNQTLLSFQMDALQDIVCTAPPHLHTLVSCGDVHLQLTQAPPALGHFAEDVDILLFGVKDETERLQRHGVFFMRRESPSELDFMLQKPSLEMIAAHTLDHTYLMDTGLWLLSDRVVQLIQERSRTSDVRRRAYDLYGEFGTALGPGSTSTDDDLRALRVRVVPLTGAVFHHLGTSAELLAATERMQRVFFDHPIPGCTVQVPPHGQTVGSFTAPVVSHNAVVQTALDMSRVENVWIENSFVGERWTLRRNTIVTGVPKNDWCLDVPDNACVDVVPVLAVKALALQPPPPSGDASSAGETERWYACRPYSLHDTFGGGVAAASTTYLGTSLSVWLARRGLSLRDVQPAGECTGDEDDIQQARLFPCCSTVEALGEALAFMLTAPPTGREGEKAEWAWRVARDRWRQTPRVSATDIMNIADLSALQQQREAFQRCILPAMAERGERRFYNADLDAMGSMLATMQLPLPPALKANVDTDEFSLRSIHHKMFCARMLEYVAESLHLGSISPEQVRSIYGCEGPSGLGQRATAYTEGAFSLLRQSLMQAYHHPPSDPSLAVHEGQVVWAHCPARVDLCGGWTDTPPYSVLYGGRVVNISVNLNGEPPIRVHIKLRNTPEILIRCLDTGAEDRVTSHDGLKVFPDVGSVFCVPRVALALAGFVPEFAATRYTSLQEQLEQRFGGSGFEMTLQVAIPTGSGLGTSSILAGTVLHALSEFCSLGWGVNDVCERVLLVEQLMTTGGGWQDQYGGLYRGVKLVQSLPGFRQAPGVQWLPERLFNDPQFRPCHVLYYTGMTRTAKTILVEIVKGVLLHEPTRLKVLQGMWPLTDMMYDAITEGNLEAYGKLIDQAGRQNKLLDSGTCPPAVQMIMDRVRSFVYGAKLVGAGGGGFVYMVAKDADNAAQLRRELTCNPPNAEACFVDMTLSETGIQVGRS